MLELFRIPRILLLDPATESRIRRRILVGARLVFWPLALTLVMLAIQVVAWQKEFNIAGPFEAETNPARHALVLAVPNEGRTPWWQQPLMGDTSEKPFQSNLKLRIDGHEMSPQHALHETIREGRTAGFSHWGPRLIFSLPPGVKNAPETIATLRYRVWPRAWVMVVLIISSAGLGWLLYNQPLISFARRLQALVPIAAPYLILFGLCCAALIGSAVYVASSLYALATGWALPTTALIRWSPIAAWAARNEPYLGHLLLTLAGVGAIATWLVGSNTEHEKSIYSNERMLRRLLVWCGFPILACAFLFCFSAIWSGLVRPGDPHWANIGGLIPFTDALGHLAAAYDQARDGTWIGFAQRRPLAAAFRTVLLFFGYDSVPVVLMLQACLLAAAACFATCAVAVWRGVWAAIAFLGMTYVYARYFEATALTEPLGLFWALLSIPFFIESLRSGCVTPALAGFAMTIVAQMTRMGSMFTIPALLLWLVWQFGHGIAAKVRIGVAAAGILIGVLGLNTLLLKTYGTDVGSTGGNLAYTLCGLTLGTTWDGCPTKLASEGKSDLSEEALAAEMYSMAWENFRKQPDVFFRRVIDNAKKFVSEFPNVMWKGYGEEIDEPAWLFRKSLTAISLLGLLFIAARRAKPAELTFWALLWASIVASASLIYFDDGPRTLAASQPLIALFFALGLSNPVLAPAGLPSPSRSSRYGALGLIAAAALFVCIPWMAHRLSPIGGTAGISQISEPGEILVFGGRRMSGFLVVEDGLPLRSDVPSIHLADFEVIVQRSRVESYQGLLHPVTPPLPFGFIFTPLLEKDLTSWKEFIVPADVMEHPDVPAWRFKVEPWQAKPDARLSYWFYVTKAEPWRLR